MIAIEKAINKTKAVSAKRAILAQRAPALARYQGTVLSDAGGPNSITEQLYVPKAQSQFPTVGNTTYLGGIEAKSSGGDQVILAVNADGGLRERARFAKPVGLLPDKQSVFPKREPWIPLTITNNGLSQIAGIRQGGALKYNSRVSPGLPEDATPNELFMYHVNSAGGPTERAALFWETDNNEAVFVSDEGLDHAAVVRIPLQCLVRTAAFIPEDEELNSPVEIAKRFERAKAVVASAKFQDVFDATTRTFMRRSVETSRDTSNVATEVIPPLKTLPTRANPHTITLDEWMADGKPSSSVVEIKDAPSPEAKIAEISNIPESLPPNPRPGQVFMIPGPAGIQKAVYTKTDLLGNLFFVRDDPEQRVIVIPPGSLNIAPVNYSDPDLGTPEATSERAKRAQEIAQNAGTVQVFQPGKNQFGIRHRLVAIGNHFIEKPTPDRPNEPIVPEETRLPRQEIRSFVRKPRWFELLPRYEEGEDCKENEDVDSEPMDQLPATEKNLPNWVKEMPPEEIRYLERALAVSDFGDLSQYEDTAVAENPGDEVIDDTIARTLQQEHDALRDMEWWNSKDDGIEDGEKDDDSICTVELMPEESLDIGPGNFEHSLPSHSREELEFIRKHADEIHEDGENEELDVKEEVDMKQELREHDEGDERIFDPEATMLPFGHAEIMDENEEGLEE